VAVLWLSVCAGVVFLAGRAGGVAVPSRAGREGQRKGVRGETSGEPWRLWGRVPPWCPPAQAVSRPQAVLCRGGWSGGLVVGLRRGSVPGAAAAVSSRLVVCGGCAGWGGLMAQRRTRKAVFQALRISAPDVNIARTSRGSVRPDRTSIRFRKRKRVSTIRPLLSQKVFTSTGLDARGVGLVEGS
jgi:hypothetical protein